MKALKVLLLFNVVFFLSSLLIAAEESGVKIQKAGGRTEAVVTSKEPPEQKVSAQWFKRPFIWSERALVGVARVSSSAVGTVTDATVKGMQSATNLLFSRLFRVLDYKSWKK